MAVDDSPLALEDMNHFSDGSPLYEADKIKFKEIVRKINEKAFRVGDRDALEREIIERYYEAGYLVTVVWEQPLDPGVIPWDSMVPGVIPEGRVNPEPFDHERQSWEVQHDILGVDETPGAMQRDGSIRSPAQVTSLTTKK
jgi:hypothetical protein